MPRPPGFLRHSEDPDVLLMIGTAGHVDHGKTRLVRFLTGCETDKLKVEKERGLSIELGFAPCSLGDGIACGIVDVPGHEQFIKNMVAGAAGMDMAILVVAADDGVMPQTVEHLQIMQFLGVSTGMVAITKIDLVSDERVEEVRREIEACVLETFLEDAPVVAVSSETFVGFEDFYRTLVDVALHAKSEKQKGVFRMPVERVFSSPGYGTVATGIPLAGSIAEGDEVEILPSNLPARVRGIQRFTRAAHEGGAGQCLALNLAGLPKDAVSRGCVVAHPGYVCAGHILHVRLSTTDNLNPPLKNNEEVRVHTGTVEVQGKLQLYGESALPRGAHGFGALVLAHAIPAAPTDRYVIRRNSPSLTVAGGSILRVLDEKPRLARAKQAEELAARWAAFGSARERLLYVFAAARAAGATLADATRETLLTSAEARAMAEALVEEGLLILTADGERGWTQEGRRDGVDAVACAVSEYCAAHATDFGPTLAQIGDSLSLPEPAVLAAVASLVEEKRLERRESRVGPPRETARFDDRRARLVEEIEAAYRKGRFATPRPDELADLLKARSAEVLPLLDYLCQSGKLVRIGKNVVFHAQWVAEAERLVVESIQKSGTLDSADFKTLIDSSRKYALAILDYFDAQHMTQRYGNLRRLHPSYLRRLEK